MNLPTPVTIKEKQYSSFMPLMQKELRKNVHDGFLLQFNCTYIDDVWTSKFKSHLTAAVISRRGIPGKRMSIRPVESEQLHTAVARSWEDFLVLTKCSAKQNHLSNVSTGNVFISSKEALSFCSDSDGVGEKCLGSRLPLYCGSAVF